MSTTFGIRRRCPFCYVGLTPVVPPPKLPDFWVRVGGSAGWWCFAPIPPNGDERASAVGYRCEECANHFRVVFSR